MDEREDQAATGDLARVLAENAALRAEAVELRRQVTELEALMNGAQTAMAAAVAVLGVGQEWSSRC